MSDKLSFIGAGNMASSIIGGLVSKGTDAETIAVSDPHSPALERVANEFGVTTACGNTQVVQGAATVLLAVKPNVMQSVCNEIGNALEKDALVISIAAGVRASDIRRWLGKDAAIIRCMPNTPALLNLGANALFANELCSNAQQVQAESLLGATGITQWVDSEEQIDTVTALSGSGPAYFFHMIECMTAAAIQMGLAEDVAETLAIETAYGAAAMARERTVPPAQLRVNVTSKGGTTAAALASFAEADFSKIVAEAMAAAKARAHSLGDELGQSAP